MAISYSQKVAILDHLANEVAPQKSIVMLTTKDAKESLNADLTTQFRKKSRESGVELKVFKNTLIKRAFDNVPDLEGPTYLAYLVDGSESDEITVPKAIVTTVKEDFEDNLNIIGSIVNGEFVDTAGTIVLSKTPSKEESMAKIAGGLNQLATRIAVSVKEIPTKVVRVMSEYSKTIEG